jgi:hypothetical protein
MRFAPAPGKRVLRQLAADHQLRHVCGPCDKLLRSLTELPAVLNLENVPFHVLGAPASRMGDERELRELAADL